MIETTFPKLDESPLAMVPEKVIRDPGGTPISEATALNGRLRLGGPVAVPVSSAFAEPDPALRTFIEQESAHSVYHLVHLALTAAHEPEQPRLEHLRLKLVLSAPGAASEPIAWSMSPQRVLDATHLETAWNLGPELKFFGVDAGLGSVKHNSTRDRAQIYLEALNELRPDPTWELRRTRAMEIRGVHRLSLVVRAPAGTPTRIDGSVYAVIARGARPWRESLQLTDLLTLSAAI